jgi:hypothetical protein
MKNETSEQTKQTWVTPVFTVLSINNETLGAGAAGVDFGSEISA